MKLNRHHQALIQYPCCCLPHYLHQIDYSEVAVILWYQDDGLTVTLLHEGTLSESGLDQSYNLLPVGGVK